jgi:hypothetical protein
MPGPLTPPPVQHGAGRGVTQPGARNTVYAAADKWHVPRWILWGVYGIETSFGSNIATSPTGAVGAFQFEPATAAGYGYPMTNTPTAAQFAQQADAAAHYLHDLLARTGSWERALNSYSGADAAHGGYGVAKVKATATGKQSKAFDAPTRPGTIARGVQDAAGALSIPGKFYGLITNPRTWLRLAEMILGIALLLMGLKSFTGGAVDPVGLATKVAARAA